MAKDRLYVREANYIYRITWSLAEEGDHGADLGDSIYTAGALEKASPEDREHILATLTAAKSVGVERDATGYFWESPTKARAALRLINLALKTDGGAPWPDWALQAKAERWTPPKGWKPS